MSITEDVAIDIFKIHSVEVVHYTHITEPMASHSHSGGPTAFRRNPPLAMTLSWPLRPNPHWAMSWVAPCLPKASTATVVAKHKRSQTGTRYHKNKQAHKVMSAYRARVPHAYNLPSLEVPNRGMTMGRIKAFP